MAGRAYWFLWFSRVWCGGAPVPLPEEEQCQIVFNLVEVLCEQTTQSSAIYRLDITITISVRKKAK